MTAEMLNRVYTIGSIDGSGNITPGAAQTSFRDLSAITGGNKTKLVIVQGASWEYMNVSKTGAVFNRVSTIDSSSGSAISFDTALPIVVTSDLGHDDLVYIDAEGAAVNATAIYNTFAPELLTDLKTTPIPASGKSVAYLRNIVSGDNQGSIYEWDPAEATAADDFFYVLSNFSASGRWVRKVFQTEISTESADGDAVNSALYLVGDDLRHKSASGIVRKVSRHVTAGVIASYANLAALKAVTITDPDGDPFKDNELIELRGWLVEGDLNRPLIGMWDKDSTNVDSLDVTYVRPSSISGSNPGRVQIFTPGAATKFANSDPSPDVSQDIVFQSADTVPGAITTLDGMRNGDSKIVYPGAQDQAYTDSAAFNMGGQDFTHQITDGPITFHKINDVISLLFSGGGGVGTRYELAGAGAATLDVPARIIAANKCQVFYGGAPVAPSMITGVAIDTPTAGTTRLTFNFTLASGVEILVDA